MEALIELFAWFQKNQFMTGMVVSGLLGGAALSLRRLLHFLREKLRSRIIVSVIVESNDHAFDWITAWLNARPSYAKMRSIRVQTERSTVNESKELPGFKREYVPQTGTYVLWLAGRPVLLSLWRERENERGYTRYKESFEISYPGRSRSLFEQILREGYLLAERKDNRISIYIVADGSWQLLESRPPRSLDSVILPEDLRETLLHDLGAFLDGRSWYESMGIPYRRGYLLYGPPGTGKSSIVAALAGHYGKNIYILNLAQTSENAMRELLADVEENSIVLMEDVDSIFRPQQPPQDAGAAATPPRTLNGLLNLLDGVEAREGRIIFMSANNVSLLPEAMIRPGRMDRALYVGYADSAQIRGMVSKFYGGRASSELVDEFIERTEDAYVTMARLQEYLLVRRDRPDDLLRDLAQLLADPQANALPVTDDR